MAQPTVTARPATWAGTSAPILYKFTSTNYSNAGYYMAVEIWNSTTAAKIADAKYYSNSTGAVVVDVAPFLKSAMSLDNTSDLSSGTVYTDGNWVKYYIKYREYWTASSESQVDDVANLRYAIYGGLQLGNTNDLTDYVDVTYNFLTLQSEGLGILGFPFLLNGYTQGLSKIEVKEYFNTTLLDTYISSNNTIGISTIKLKSAYDTTNKFTVSIKEITLDTWATQTVPTSDIWRKPAYNGSIYVSVSSGGLVMTSSDAVTWTNRTAAAANRWQSVVWADGLSLFVAVSSDGSSNRCMTSPDGITWTSRTTPNREYQSVAYGNGVLVAVADSTPHAMTSPDGVTWTERSLTGAGWQSIAFGNSVFIAVSSSATNRVAKTSDGITWSFISAPTSNWRAVAYGDEMFVAVALSGTVRAMKSADAGTTWESGTAAEVNEWRDIAFGDGVFVAVSSTGTNKSMYSVDGLNWASKALGTDCRHVSFGDSLFIGSPDSASTSLFTTTVTETQNSELKTVNIIEECSNVVMLTWRNSLGGWESFPFTINQEYTWHYSDRKAKRLTLYADNLTLSQWEAIQGLNTLGDLYRSPITEMTTSINRTSATIGQSVYVLNSDGSKIGVNVIGQANTTQTKQKTHSAFVTIEYPELFLQ